MLDRKSTRLNSSHLVISYAVFCLKKKNTAPRPADVGRVQSRPVRPIYPYHTTVVDLLFTSAREAIYLNPNPLAIKRLCVEVVQHADGHNGVYAYDSFTNTH